MVQSPGIRPFMLISTMNSAMLVLTCDGSESWHPALYIDVCNEFSNSCGNTWWFRVLAYSHLYWLLQRLQQYVYWHTMAQSRGIRPFISILQWVLQRFVNIWWFILTASGHLYWFSQWVQQYPCWRMMVQSRGPFISIVIKSSAKVCQHMMVQSPSIWPFIMSFQWIEQSLW